MNKDILIQKVNSNILALNGSCNLNELELMQKLINNRINQLKLYSAIGVYNTELN